MAATPHEVMQALSSQKVEVPPDDIWTPPPTDPLELSKEWNRVREVLLLKKKYNPLPEPISVWVPSQTTKDGDCSALLEPYGITIVKTIRRIECGDVFCDQDGHKETSEEACKLVAVLKEDVHDLMPEIVEIRDRYRYHKMFTSLMEGRLFKPTPLAYKPAFGPGCWRPERCIDLGGQELEGEGWRFPPLLRASSEDGDEVQDERGRDGTDRYCLTEDMLSNQDDEPAFEQDGKDAVAADTNADCADLTVENLCALLKADAAAQAQLQGRRLQLDGALESVSAYGDEIDLVGQIYNAEPETEGIKAKDLKPDAMAMVLFDSVPARQSRWMVLFRNFLSTFRGLWSVKRSDPRPAQMSDGDGKPGSVTNKSSDPDNKTTMGTVDLDPFKEDDPSTKYLTTPFETERYHVLSKHQGPRNPYYLDRPIHIAGHPAMPGLMHYSPRTKPWRAPAVSYWCRPVNFNPDFLASKLGTGNIPDSEGNHITKGFRAHPGLNNITCPYLSVVYVDVTGCYDAQSYTRTTNLALTDLSISMTTAVYNSFLLSGAGLGVSSSVMDTTPTLPGKDGHGLAGEGEKRGDTKPESESGSGSDTKIGPEDANVLFYDRCKTRLRHYGICIGLKEYSCWVAEPKLSTAGIRVARAQPGGQGHLPPDSGPALVGEEVPAICTETGSESVACASDKDDTACSERLGCLGSTSSRAGWEWGGCTITKVAEGSMDKYMDLDVLVEFINRAHEYGMGSFVAGVAADLGG